MALRKKVEMTAFGIELKGSPGAESDATPKKALRLNVA